MNALLLYTFLITSVSVIFKKSVNECHKVDIEFVIFAEESQVFFPIQLTHSLSDGVLTPVSHNQLSVRKWMSGSRLNCSFSENSQ